MHPFRLPTETRILFNSNRLLTINLSEPFYSLFSFEILASCLSLLSGRLPLKHRMRISRIHQWRALQQTIIPTNARSWPSPFSCSLNYWFSSSYILRSASCNMGTNRTNRKMNETLKGVQGKSLLGFKSLKQVRNTLV